MPQVPGLRCTHLWTCFGHALDMVLSGHMPMQAVELRSRLQREIAAKEKEAKERELRELAMRARMDRVGGGAPAPAASRAAGTAAAGPPSGWRSCRHISSPRSGPYLSHLASDLASQHNHSRLFMQCQRMEVEQHALGHCQAACKACCGCLL